MSRILAAIILLILCSFTLTSCQTQINSYIKPNIDIEIQEGKSAISGYLVKGNSSEPAGELVVRLGDVIWNDDKSGGSFIIDGANSPSTIADENGLFVFNNIEVSDYVIVVGNIEEVPIVIVQKTDKEKAEIYSPKVNEILYVGTLNLDEN
ncbi:MAG: hypothetical protein CVU40_10430 [Chloroflexi bacterium HGW-Chloroflexi-2]|jgi:hypothetical protein|nr:MAG: hypothetical protein CVU40_10430 [Chloroflexi bacterium HGW-Chloroflexi-2]